MAKQKDGKSVQSIDRAFDILESLSSDRNGRRLIELSEELDLHKSTVHRILNAMQERGYIEKEDRKYKLGLQFIHLSSQFLNNIELKTEAEPYLRELSDKTGQTVFLAVRESDEVVYIDKVEQYNSLRRYSIIGARAPIYCTSLGRALLFDENEESLKKALRGLKIRQLTRYTNTDKADIAEKILYFKRRGWSEDIEEHHEGVRCVGAPIYDYRKRVAAAISTAWNTNKTHIDSDETGLMVKKTADEISSRLGYIVVQDERH